MRPSRRWIGALALVPCLGCADDGTGGPAASSSFRPTVTVSTEGRLVDVGGRRVYIECTGTEPPTVVMEAGYGGNANVWEGVRLLVGGDRRTCAYDRAGAVDGSSEPRPLSIVTTGDMARELAVLLDRAGERPPFVLVAHELGGLVARMFAAANPRDVGGLVLVDASHEDVDLGGPPLAEGRSIIDFEASGRELHRAGDLGSTPLVVITAGEIDPGFREHWTSLQRRLAALSSDVVHVRARRSDHQIPRRQPELVAEAVDVMATAVASREPLPPCGRQLERAGGSCIDR